MLRKPPDILITTPESLYLMLTSRAREILTEVEAVIVDEIHAVAQTKRGAHMALTLERLDPRRVTEEGGPRPAADRPVGDAAPARADRPVPRRAAARVQDRRRRPQGEVDLEDRRPGRGHDRPGRRRSPAPRRASRVPASRDFEGARQPPLDLAGDLPGAARTGARAHLDDHLRQQPPRRRAAGEAPERDRQGAARAGAAGDRARGQRQAPARRPLERIRRDRPRPPRLARPRGAPRRRGAAQVGPASLPRRHLLARARHRHGRRRPRDPGRVAEVGDPRASSGSAAPATSSARSRKGRIFPKFRADLLECAVVAQRMREGEIEETVIPRNPLDVLAQHIVSIVADDEWEVDEIEKLVVGAEPFTELSASSSRTCSTCSTAATRPSASPSCARGSSGTAPPGTVRGRKGARQLAVTNAGTIPDRGLYGVHLPDGRRVGELDEEMVYEARAGPGLPARRDDLADRGDHPRPRDRHPGARASPARCRSGAATASAARPSSAGRSASSPARRSSMEPAKLAKDYDLDQLRGREPRRLPARAAGGDPRRPLRRDDRRRALPRRDRRLAALRPLAVRRPRPRRLGPGALGEDPRRARRSRPTRSGPTTGSSSTCPTPTRRPPPDLVLLEPDEVEDLVVAELSRLGAVRLALPRERGAARC